MKKKKCKHEYIVSGKYFGLFCCPHCMKYFTKRIPCWVEEIRADRDAFIEIKLTPTKNI